MSTKVWPEVIAIWRYSLSNSMNSPHKISHLRTLRFARWKSWIAFILLLLLLLLSATEILATKNLDTILYLCLKTQTPVSSWKNLKQV